MKHNYTLMLVAAFLALWLYSEWSEYIGRDMFLTEVQGFVSKGDRFTDADGKALEARINELEQKIQQENP